MEGDDEVDSNDEEEVPDYAEISKTPMGKTNVKYSPDPFTIIGKGRTAIVYPGYHFGILKRAAVKYIEKQYVRSDEEHKNELKVWSNIDQNTNIIRLYDSHRDPKRGMFLAMELATRTLTDQIIKFHSPKDQVIVWLHQICSAVAYLHVNGVIHRDIKPDNVLMVELQTGNGMIAKLGDFGVSRMLSHAERSGTFSNSNGTIYWMAPEAITNQTVGKLKNTRMLDIYTLGMTMYFGLSGGGHPFTKKSNNKNEDTDDDLGQILSSMTRESAKPMKLNVNQHAANDLLPKTMRRHPEDRPQIVEILAHCLFWSWEKEQQFLIRVAICLSRRNCPVIENIKTEIDDKYAKYYGKVNNGRRDESSFNWLEIANEKKGLDIEDLLFTTATRTKPTTEYGTGESVTKFMKFFRDKYVHYPEMKPEATLEFSERGTGVFCEEKYVKLLTSICPGLTTVLYRNLQTYANEPSVMPLSEMYYPWKFSMRTPKEEDVGSSHIRKKSHNNERNKLGEDWEPGPTHTGHQLGNSDIFIQNLDDLVKGGIAMGYFGKPSKPCATKSFQMSSAIQDYFATIKDNWSDIWLAANLSRSPFLVSVYGLVEQHKTVHVAMEVASSNLHDDVTNGVLDISKDEDFDQVVRYCKNVAEALDWFQANNYVHYRIRAKNVLIFGNKKIAKLGISDPTKYKRAKSVGFVNDMVAVVITTNFVLTGGKFPDQPNEGVVPNAHKMYAAHNLLRWTMQVSTETSAGAKIWQFLDHPLFWDSETCLQFLCDFSGVLQNTMIRWEANVVNPRKGCFYQNKFDEEFQWIDKVDSRLVEGMDKELLKNFPSLLDFIDKSVKRYSDKSVTAFANQKSDVILELFCSPINGEFSRMKFFKYFITRFPEMVMLSLLIIVKLRPRRDQFLKYINKSVDKGLNFDSWRVMPLVIDEG